MNETFISIGYINMYKYKLKQMHEETSNVVVCSATIKVIKRFTFTLPSLSTYSIQVQFSTLRFFPRKYKVKHINPKVGI